MPLVYITGPAGSGKSTVMRALQRRGIRAYDQDDPGMGAAHDRQTGEIASVPPIAERTTEWFDTHEWRILDAAMNAIRTEANNGLVVLCGNSIRSDQLLDTFDRIIYLHVDEATMRSRIATRTDNDYGKNEHELEHAFERAHQLAQIMDHHKTIAVDATQPIDAVVADVMQALQTVAT